MIHRHFKKELFFLFAILKVATTQSVSCEAIKLAYTDSQLSNGQTGCCDSPQTSTIDSSSCVASKEDVTTAQSRLWNVEGSLLFPPGIVMSPIITNMTTRGGSDDYLLQHVFPTLKEFVPRGHVAFVLTHSSMNIMNGGNVQSSINSVYEIQRKYFLPNTPANISAYASNVVTRPGAMTVTQNGLEPVDTVSFSVTVAPLSQWIEGLLYYRKSETESGVLQKVFADMYLGFPNYAFWHNGSPLALTRTDEDMQSFVTKYAEFITQNSDEVKTDSGLLGDRRSGFSSVTLEREDAKLKFGGIYKDFTWIGDVQNPGDHPLEPTTTKHMFNNHIDTSKTPEGVDSGAILMLHVLGA